MLIKHSACNIFLSIQKINSIVSWLGITSIQILVFADNVALIIALESRLCYNKQLRESHYNTFPLGEVPGWTLSKMSFLDYLYVEKHCTGIYIITNIFTWNAKAFTYLFVWLLEEVE